tara:strand:- start:2627 stop:3799 length:1173 start_codon:yes stop_codon:yes gene_type:complete
VWIIDRSGQQVRSFSGTEIDLLERYANDDLVGKSVELANAILRRVRQDNQWLRCSCQKPNPVMHIALLDSGRFVLRNNPGGNDHEQRCAFGRSIKRGGSHVDARVKVKRYDLGIVISPHSEYRDGDGNSSPESTDKRISPGGVRHPTLSLILTLLDDAGLNTYDPANRLKLGEQFQRIRDAANRYSLANGVPLSSAMDTVINKPRLIALGKRLLANTAKGVRPVGFLLDRVDSIASRAVHPAEGNPVEFLGHVERFGDNDEPLLAMATVTPARKHSRFFDLGHVATVPVVSRYHLFPVTSEVERLVVIEVIKLTNWLGSKQVAVTLQKPLFAGDGSPDLILKSRKKTLGLYIGTAADMPDVKAKGGIVMPETGDLQPAKNQIIAFFMRED